MILHSGSVTASSSYLTWAVNAETFLNSKDNCPINQNLTAAAVVLL
jgi:hypothetical protein